MLTRMDWITIIGLVGGILGIVSAIYGFSKYIRKKLRTRLGQPTPLIHKRLKDYWGGFCPHCGQHIGINVMQHRLTDEKFGICGSCGKKFDPEKAECLEKRDSTGKVIFKREDKV